MSGKNSANPALNLSLAFDDVLLTPDYSDCLPADVSVVSQLTPTLTLGAPAIECGDGYGNRMAHGGGDGKVGRHGRYSQKS